MKTHYKGMLLTGSGVLLVSPDALFIRLIDAPPLDLLFWRGAMMALAMCLIILIRERRDMKAFMARFSGVTVIAALFGIVMYFSFVSSITYTHAANALAILAATPLLAAVIGRVFFAERLAWFTWAAAITVVVLIAVVVSDSLAQGSGRGAAAALSASLALATLLTIFRAHPDLSRLQVFALAGAISSAICAALATPFSFSEHQMSLTLVLTIFLLPAATLLMTLGPRYIPAAEAGLLVLLESVFGPLWVYLGIGEAPSLTTLMCGGAILVCVAWHAIVANRHERFAFERQIQ